MTQFDTDAAVDWPRTPPALPLGILPFVRVNPLSTAPFVKYTQRIRFVATWLWTPSIVVNSGPETLWIFRAFVTATRLDTPPTNRPPLEYQPSPTQISSESPAASTAS